MLKHFGFGRRRSTTKTVNVITLDGSTLPLQIESRSPGSDVLQRALEICCVHSEREYFGLIAPDAPFTKWLNLNKPIKKQLTGHSPYVVQLRIKMYPRDHHSLLHPTTRHNLYLQVKQDLQQSRLQCSNPSLLHRLAALIVQSELGDFNAPTCAIGYLKDLNVLPFLTKSGEEAITQLHMLNRGRSSQDCEEELLDLAQDEPTYGAVCYNVQDSTKQSTQLCICPIGVKVQQANAVIAFHEWESILKISSRGKTVSYQISASRSLTSYQYQFNCASAEMATNIVSWCQTLHNFYCKLHLKSTDQIDRPKSKLKRFFSSRRSVRRRPLISNPMPQSSSTSAAQTSSLLGARRSSVELKTSHLTSRTSLWSLPARTDSKLVIYGASGIASPAHSISATPTHNTEAIQAHTTDVTSTSLDVISEDTTPSLGYNSLSRERPVMNEVVRVGSVADVEHKSVSSLIERRRRSSGGQSSNYDHRTSSRISVTVEPELGRHDNYQRHTEDSQPSLEHDSYFKSSNEHVPNKLSSSSPNKTSNEYLRRKMGSTSPHRSSTEHVQKRLSSGGSHRSSREFVIRRVSGDYSKHTSMSGEYKQSNDSLHHRQESLDKTTPTRSRPQYQNVTPTGLKSSSQYDHSSHNSPPSKQQQQQQRKNNYYSSTNGNQTPPWYMSNSDLQESSLSNQISGHSLPAHSNTETKHNRSKMYNNKEPSEAMWYQDERSTGYHGNRRQHHSSDHTHLWNGHTHKRIAPIKRMSHDQSPDSELPLQNGVFERRSKSRSLPRDVTPERVDEESDEYFRKPRVIDPAHPARPKNRGPFRLSLQDSTFYDTTRQQRGGSARWTRHPTITSISTASLSQPSDLLEGIASKLGSIASLEYQASLAELSQAESSSFIDPHIRSFIFEGSQTNSQGTEL